MLTSNDMIVIGAEEVEDFLENGETALIDLIERVYMMHHDGKTENPDSYFLRFPGSPVNRIIALPAHMEGDEVTAVGLKWISSFPGNLQQGLQRASAVVVLNDPATGYARALVEGSRISAARTAASAALAVRVLHGAPARIGVVGTGPIAQATLRFIAAVYPVPVPVKVHDLNPDSTARMIASHGEGYLAAPLDEVLTCDVVLFATSAGTPHISPDKRFEPGQLVLNISLRDLAPISIREANNVFDDVEHCMKAKTTPHLLEQLDGNRDFVTGTLAEIDRGEKHLNPNRPTVFSPFGLGVLDLAVAQRIYESVAVSGAGVRVPNFHGDMKR